MKHNIQFPNTTVLDRFETAAGRDIPNYQEHSIVDFGDAQAQRAKFRKEFPDALPRTTEPTSIYNCHGFVFAAGRTGIDSSRDVRMILSDDGYVKMEPDRALPGDVVLYVSPTGDVEHSAVLVQTADQTITRFPYVVSKWGNFTEYVHAISNCPYDATHIEYWRLGRRPIPQETEPDKCLIQC